MERRGQLKALFLGSIVLVGVVELGWYALGVGGTLSDNGVPNLYALEFLLFLFFCGFNILEASQPSLASKMASPATRGATMGVYNTLQSLGVFAGAVGGGWLTKSYGAGTVFLASSAFMVVWLVVAAPMHIKHKPAAAS
jgi:predicted MFS family arabinose efflux permease